MNAISPPGATMRNGKGKAVNRAVLGVVVTAAILAAIDLGYSYVTVGNADARGRLGQPLADGHLLFAGEACHDGFAGTVAGAWLIGQQAAGVAARAVRGV